MRQKSWFSEFQLCFFYSLGSISEYDRRYSFSAGELPFFFFQLIAQSLPFLSPMTEDSMSINACQSSGEKVAGKGRCKENHKSPALSICTPRSGVVSRLPSTIPSHHIPSTLLFLFPVLLSGQQLHVNRMWEL